MQKQLIKFNWLYIFTPCTISALFFAYVIVDGYASLNASGGWSYLGVIYAGLPLIVVLLLDIILKLAIKKKIGLIWLIEGIIVIVTFLLLALQIGII